MLHLSFSNLFEQVKPINPILFIYLRLINLQTPLFLYNSSSSPTSRIEILNKFVYLSVPVIGNTDIYKRETSFGLQTLRP
jgi:hypothetical protein